MDFIGDLERFFAELWPFRVPLTIGLIVGIAIVGYIAWRRGWFGVAAAHPRTSIVVVALIVVIVGPLGWILGSPLIIRTELNEEVPVAATGTTASVLLEGEFIGADEFHFGSGQALLKENDLGELTLRFDDFSVLNGPDLFVYLSPDPDGWTPDAVLLGSLKATDGSFSYDVPDDVDPATLGSAVIWCRAFSVLFAHAELGPAAA